jgi:hypothetical protein
MVHDRHRRAKIASIEGVMPGVGAMMIRTAVFVGQLAWHAAGEIAANGRAQMNEGARGTHNKWDSDIMEERRARGRIRSDQ